MASSPPDNRSVLLVWLCAPAAATAFAPLVFELYLKAEPQGASRAVAAASGREPAAAESEKSLGDTSGGETASSAHLVPLLLSISMAESPKVINKVICPSVCPTVRCNVFLVLLPAALQEVWLSFHCLLGDQEGGGVGRVPDCEGGLGHQGRGVWRPSTNSHYD